MSTSPNRRELFRMPSAKDKLTLFQILLDAKLLTDDVSLALLKVIHKELGENQEDDRSVYKDYAVSISALKYYTSGMLQHVVEKWKSANGGE